MDAIRSAVETLREQDLVSLPIDRLAADLVELRQLLDWLEGEWTRRLAAFSDRDGIDLEGHSSTTAFLKHRCRMSGARAHRAVAMAHRLPLLSFVTKAFEAGDISLDQTRLFLNLPDHLADELVRDEVCLVNGVALLPVADTRRVVDYWKAVVDGPGCETSADELVERRYLYASKTLEGMVRVDGLLDPVEGDVLLTALAAATPPRREGDLRSPAQRRVDGLADICRVFLDSGEAPGAEKPHLLVLADVEALCGHGGGIHETANGHMLTPHQVRQISCDSVISRVVFGPDGEPVDLGRASRVIPPAMRRAVIARDRHCTHPGCDRPPRWTDIHHIRHWADGGPTAVSNLRLLCRYHHTLEHRRHRLLE
ncbi:MAG TPA: DUF222 domain-containing protein [Acidimicrobiia bacterium]|nr:DUF222 domain-containing protein [Acidimicrobiia bacterium]